MENKEEMNLLFSVNKKFLDELKDMLFSVAYNNKRFLNVYIMNIELDDDDINFLSKFVAERCHGKLIPLKFDISSIKNMPVTDDEGDYFGLEAYARIFSPYTVSEDVKRLLYLDADMLCNENLEELYDMDFEGNCIIACEDKGIDLETKKRLDLPMDYQYINSGVLLMNLEALRKEYTEEELVSLILSQSKILNYIDQDFINKNFKNKIKIVSNKYNFLTKDLDISKVDYKPAIYHYAGSVKPWHDNVNRFSEELLAPYYENLEREGEIDKLNRLRKVHSENRNK